jgi:hypothetical protein
MAYAKRTLWRTRLQECRIVSHLGLPEICDRAQMHRCGSTLVVGSASQARRQFVAAAENSKTSRRLRGGAGARMRACSDVRLCVDEAETLGVPMVLGAAFREILAITNARFGSDSDFTSIARLIEDWAGVQIRG